MLSQCRVMWLLRRRSRVRTATVVTTAQLQAQQGLYVIRLLWLRSQAAMHHSRRRFLKRHLDEDALTRMNARANLELITTCRVEAGGKNQKPFKMTQMLRVETEAPATPKQKSAYFTLFRELVSHLSWQERVERVTPGCAPRARSARGARSHGPTRSRCSSCRRRHWRASCAACR